MLDMKILDGQTINESDSSLASLRNSRPTYRQLIEEVFVDQWWSSPETVELPPKA